MPSGTWVSFHETMIYEYLTHRFQQGNLRLRQIAISGQLQSKQVWIKVDELAPITDTRFPDINQIRLKGERNSRAAEVKYLTSSFNYHQDKKYAEAFKKFTSSDGFIIVLRHDFLPKNLFSSFPTCDIYEIDEVDFVSFAIENFTRLLNRQLKLHKYQKFWVMQQSKNFWFNESEVLPAYKSGLWCPSDKLTTFDLGVGDTVIFVRHKGRSYQKVANCWSEKSQIIDNWFLMDVFIGRVTLPLQSRIEYCQRHKVNPDAPIWYDETVTSASDSRVRHRTDKWQYVFGFNKVVYLKSLHIPLSELVFEIPEFVTAIREVYATHVSREIPQSVYTQLLEYIAAYENNRKQFNQDIYYPMVSQDTCGQPTTVH